MLSAGASSASVSSRTSSSAAASSATGSAAEATVGADSAGASGCGSAAVSASGVAGVSAGASSSEMIRRIDAGISSIVGSWGDWSVARHAARSLARLAAPGFQGRSPRTIRRRMRFFQELRMDCRRINARQDQRAFGEAAPEATSVARRRLDHLALPADDRRARRRRPRRPRWAERPRGPASRPSRPTASRPDAGRDRSWRPDHRFRGSG